MAARAHCRSAVAGGPGVEMEKSCSISVVRPEASAGPQCQWAAGRRRLAARGGLIDQAWRGRLSGLMLAQPSSVNSASEKRSNCSWLLMTRASRLLHGQGMRSCIAGGWNAAKGST